MATKGLPAKVPDFSVDAIDRPFAKEVDHEHRRRGRTAAQPEWRRRLAAPGFVLVPDVAAGLRDEAEKWFGKRYWDALPADPEYEFRRQGYARLALDPVAGTVTPLPRKLFAIPVGENAKLGDKPRVFGPCPDGFAADAFTRALVWRMYDAMPVEVHGQDGDVYHVGLHQMRITEDGTGSGLPTPEGIHQDGARFVCIMFVERTNVQPEAACSGVYTLAACNGEAHLLSDKQHEHNERCRLAKHVMRQAFEAVVLNDRRVKHDATGIRVADEEQGLAVRDVFVMTFMSQHDDEHGLGAGEAGKY